MHLLYEYQVNAENKIDIDEKTSEQVLVGTNPANDKIVSVVKDNFEKTGKPTVIGFDGNYGINWSAI